MSVVSRIRVDCTDPTCYRWLVDNGHIFYCLLMHPTEKDKKISCQYPSTQASHLVRAASTRSLFDIQLQCRDTYWVKSFNNVILIYCPKRIHFADRTFNMRISVAVLDWVTSM